jgi:hypothetical protein
MGCFGDRGVGVGFVLLKYDWNEHKRLMTVLTCAKKSSSPVWSIKGVRNRDEREVGGCKHVHTEGGGEGGICYEAMIKAQHLVWAGQGYEVWRGKRPKRCRRLWIGQASWPHSRLDPLPSRWPYPGHWAVKRCNLPSKKNTHTIRNHSLNTSMRGWLSQLFRSNVLIWI